jgi:TnpA family transposase
MTEWHVRYGGRGVMIYWHVEHKSTWIYSQLKTCSSSEVAAMIEGVLRHCINNFILYGKGSVSVSLCRAVPSASLS